MNAEANGAARAARQAFADTVARLNEVMARSGVKLSNAKAAERTRRRLEAALPHATVTLSDGRMLRASMPIVGLGGRFGGWLNAVWWNKRKRALFGLLCVVEFTKHAQVRLFERMGASTPRSQGDCVVHAVWMLEKMLSDNFVGDGDIFLDGPQRDFVLPLFYIRNGQHVAALICEPDHVETGHVADPPTCQFVVRCVTVVDDGLLNDRQIAALRESYETGRWLYTDDPIWRGMHNVHNGHDRVAS